MINLFLLKYFIVPKLVDEVIAQFVHNLTFICDLVVKNAHFLLLLVFSFCVLGFSMLMTVISSYIMHFLLDSLLDAFLNHLFRLSLFEQLPENKRRRLHLLLFLLVKLMSMIPSFWSLLTENCCTIFEVVDVAHKLLGVIKCFFSLANFLVFDSHSAF